MEGLEQVLLGIFLLLLGWMAGVLILTKVKRLDQATIKSKLEAFKQLEVHQTTVEEVDEIFGEPRTGFKEPPPIEYHDYFIVRRYYKKCDGRGYRIECRFDNYGILQEKSLKDLR